MTSSSDATSTNMHQNQLKKIAETFSEAEQIQIHPGNIRRQSYNAIDDDIDSTRSLQMISSGNDINEDTQVPAEKRSSVHALGGGHVGVSTTKNLRRVLRREKSLRLLGASSKDYQDGSNPAFGYTNQNSDGSLLDPRFNSERTEADQNPSMSTVAVLKDMVFGKWLNIFLLFIPVAFLSHFLQWSSMWIFWLNFIAMVPLASLLGDFTEELAAHTNQVIGGLINASFGNAVEIVVAIQALLANEIRVVQASMIGSVFSNLLLVLGCCFFFGGLKYSEQSFNSTSATANMSLLALSTIALVLPTPFAEYYDIEEERVLEISRVAAIFLMFMYIQLLVFQLRTHTYLNDSQENEHPELSFWVAMGGLIGVTLLISQLSEYLVDSIDGFCEDSGVSRTFVGLIILPIVGNGVEHITAVSVAMKNKMDLAMGIAMGSCTQISLFVIPLTVLVGWIANKDMTLNFPHFEITLYVLSVVIVSICVSNPKSNWLEGSLLVTTYIMIAVGFWFEKVVDF